jgi:L-fucose mutarotase
MLTGISPILTGELLAVLDAMGHSDAVVVADAHFPAERLGRRCIALPALGASDVVRAVRTVVPLDDDPALDLMRSAEGSQRPVQTDLIAAAGCTSDTVRFLERQAFYDEAATAFAVIRTGETAPYGNALLRKGLVEAPGAPAVPGPAA